MESSLEIRFQNLNAELKDLHDLQETFTNDFTQLRNKQIQFQQTTVIPATVNATEKPRVKSYSTKTPCQVMIY